MGTPDLVDVAVVARPCLSVGFATLDVVAGATLSVVLGLRDTVPGADGARSPVGPLVTGSDLGAVLDCDENELFGLADIGVVGPEPFTLGCSKIGPL